MAKLLDIEILKWDEFNPKRDQKTYTWLRLSNDILTDPKLFGLDAEQKLCWIEVLCQASKKNCGQIRINLDQIAHVAHVKVAKIEQLIDFLVAAEVIHVHDRALPRDVVEVVAPLQITTPTNERTNDTYVTNNLVQPEGRTRQIFDFKEIYLRYPRHQGKSEGFRRCKAQIKTPEDFEKLRQAVERYRTHVEREGLEPKFIKLFSSFMSGWQDWLDPDVGTAVVNQPEDRYAFLKAVTSAPT